MSEKISSRQHEILEHLLNNKSGLSIDELAIKLDVSRTAIKQHFVALEKDGHIQQITRNKTAGRPVVIYGITNKGINHFPKQYAWFSELVLADLQEELGAERFSAYMYKLGLKLANKLRSQFDGKSSDQRLAELSLIMTNLGYQVSATTEPETDLPMIQAANCVYHDIAQQHPEICQFDLALMSSLLDKKVEQLGCMANGDCACRFRIK